MYVVINSTQPIIGIEENGTFRRLTESELTRIATDLNSVHYPRKIIKGVQKVTEEFVDDYIGRHGKAPSYGVIANHFNISRPTALNRCRNFLSKMNKKKGSE